MRRKINNIVSVICSFFRFSIMRVIHGKALSVSGVERFSPNVVFEMNKGAHASIGKKVRVHSGSKIKIRKNGELYIGQGVKMNYNCIVVCRKEINIGAGTEFGPNVCIYDHDHDYSVGLKNNKFTEERISIGSNCWVGANTIILKGTTIGDDCVIGAGSIITGTIPSKTLLIQKRENQYKTI